MHISKYTPLKGESKTAKSCHKFGIENGLRYLFTRIVMNANVNMNIDHFLVYDYSHKDPEVIKELIDLGINEESVIEILYSLKLLFEASALECLEYDNIHPEQKAFILRKNAMKSIVVFKPKNIQPLIEIRNRNTQKTVFKPEFNVYLKVNNTHIEKLISKYIDNKHTIPDMHDIGVESRIFCVLMRYETLGGSGYQGSIPKYFFDELVRTENSPLIECFASPLNNTMDVYYSKYYDTDRYFGSRGSFFDNFKETQGYYEANPPFIVSVIDKMFERFNYLFENATGTYVVTFFLPYWPDAEFYKNIHSKWCVFTKVLIKKEHEYIDGAQHKSDRTTWKANADSLCIVFSNDASKSINYLLSLLNE